MALKVTYKPTKFATLFGCNKPGYEDLDDWGVLIYTTKEGFSLKAEDKVIMGNIPLKEGVIEMAKDGKLPSAAQQVMATLIDKAYKHAGNWSHWTKEDPSKIGEAEAKSGMTPLSEFFTDEPKGEPVPEPVPEEITNPAIIGDATPDMGKVPLAEAKALYQPVNGTSSSSTYHCVGITVEGLNFAARYQGDALSIRVEGPVTQYRDALIAAGFNAGYIDSKGTYSSVHFHGVDKLMANRALGAVLLGTGLGFQTAMPMVDKFAGEGS